MYKEIEHVLEQADEASEILAKAYYDAFELIKEYKEMGFKGNDVLCPALFEQLDDLTHGFDSDIGCRFTGIRILHNYIMFREYFKHVPYSILSKIVGKDTADMEVKRELLRQGMNSREIFEFVKSVRAGWLKYFGGYLMEGVIAKINELMHYDPYAHES